MATPNDIVTAALTDIGALAPGEPIDPNLGNAAFNTLNDFIDMLSNERLSIPYITEIVHTLVSGTYQYTVGMTGTIHATVTGSIAGTVLTITGITNGAPAIGQIVTGAGVSAGTQIVSFGTGGGTQLTGIGTYNVNNSQTVGSITMTLYYQRPLRINSAFVRVSTLDYPVAVLNVEEYELIGLKALNGPWPRALYYQPSMPLGNITYWPNPSSGEMHLYADTVLGQFVTLSDTLQIPQGYKFMLRWNLGALLMPSYGKSDQLQTQMVMKNAADSLAAIKRTNMHPPPVAQYDDVLKAGRRKDAGWILHGGFL